MKLKEFNSENCISVKSRSQSAAIVFDGKVGTIRINKAACNLLGLSSGSEIKFHQDEENEDWYVEVVKEKGFQLRISGGATKDSLIFNNTKLVRNLFESVGFNSRSGRVLVAGTPTVLGKQKLYGLLTATLRN